MVHLAIYRRCAEADQGPLVIKGILDPEDAKLAIEHGADAIIVSNRGGHSMDYSPSSLEVLPEIVAAVNGKIPILFDSGIRRGADIFKALALGAHSVMIGRTTRWGLAAFGSASAQQSRCCSRNSSRWRPPRDAPSCRISTRRRSGAVLRSKESRVECLGHRGHFSGRRFRQSWAARISTSISDAISQSRAAHIQPFHCP